MATGAPIPAICCHRSGCHPAPGASGLSPGIPESSHRDAVSLAATDINDAVQQVYTEGYRDVIVAPIGFLCDHVERCCTILTSGPRRAGGPRHDAYRRGHSGHAPGLSHDAERVAGGARAEVRQGGRTYGRARTLQARGGDWWGITGLTVAYRLTRAAQAGRSPGGAPAGGRVGVWGTVLHTTRTGCSWNRDRTVSVSQALGRTSV